MTPDERALAFRAIAAPGWRWLPGMRDTDGWTVLAVTSYGIRWARYQDGVVEEVVGATNGPDVPDLTDPATLGAVLGMVREWWGANVSTVAADGRWVIVEGICSSLLYDGRYFYGDTEAAALVAALEVPRG